MHNVIVTGASRGLGLAIAQTLAAEGYCVIAIARSESDEFRAVHAALGAIDQATPGGLHFRSFDLAQIGGIAELVSGVRAQFGPIYGLVNNVGIGTAGILSMMRDADIEHMVKLNTISPMVLSKYVLRSMMSERAGRIINMSSIVSVTGYSGLSAYAATKASMIGFTRSLAREVGQLDITVNAVAPGFTATEMTGDLATDDREKIARRSALRRMIDPRDVADAVSFLLSAKARNITGTTLTVDAGNTA
jgi:3-oxoacyl-[acyl-carrier protein] reductase